MDGTITARRVSRAKKQQPPSCLPHPESPHMNTTASLRSSSFYPPLHSNAICKPSLGGERTGIAPRGSVTSSPATPSHPTPSAASFAKQPASLAMVFLTSSLWIRTRVTDRFWRKQQILKHALHFRGRKNRCYSLAYRAVRRAFVYATKARYLKKRDMRMFWETRIEAASLEHGVKYHNFISGLYKCQVELNRKSLADLAIYEPKTFKSLAALAKRRGEEGLVAAQGEGKEPEGIFSRLLKHP